MRKRGGIGRRNGDKRKERWKQLAQQLRQDYGLTPPGSQTSSSSDDSILLYAVISLKHQ